MAITAKPTLEASNQAADADEDEKGEEGRNQFLKGRTNMRQIREADNQVDHLRGNAANFNRHHLQARQGHLQVRHVRQRQAETEARPGEEKQGGGRGTPSALSPAAAPGGRGRCRAKKRRSPSPRR
jgi:hypothetical protein